MEYRLLGASGFKVPVLSLGTATFGGEGAFRGFGTSDAAEATRLVDVCLDAGLTMFDSADAYLSSRVLWHLAWESHLSYSESTQNVRSDDGLGEALRMSDPCELETAEYECLVSPSARETSQLKPESTTVRADFGAVSHPGKVRNQNEDHFLVFRLGRNQETLLTNIPADQLPEPTGEAGYSMIVADGIGGNAAGEVASRLAITTALKLVHKSPKWGFKINQKEARELFERINYYLREIDKTLTERGYADPRLFGMGTTLTAAFSMGVDLFIIHLGDSRAYLYRNGALQRLTKDHTMAQAMADAGYIAPEDVRRHVRRNTLTNYLGGQHGKVKADLRWLRLTDGDRLLLCTDGLSEMVDDQLIARILHERDQPRDAANALLDEALEQGGKDNVTVIVARYEIPRPSASSTQDTNEG
jgi:serine/threonine protein phosphatase PrpC